MFFLYAQMQCSTIHQKPFTTNRYNDSNFSNFFVFLSSQLVNILVFVKARSIQELAKKKFERVRIEVERSEKELKLEQSTKSNSYIKKQPPKKPFFRTLQEPIGSDFSSGATLAATGDVQNGSNPIHGVNCEVPSNNIDGQVEGSSSFFDTTNQDKAEELFSGIVNNETFINWNQCSLVLNYL